MRQCLWHYQASNQLADWSARQQAYARHVNRGSLNRGFLI
jgi:hypothetical protein